MSDDEAHVIPKPVSDMEQRRKDIKNQKMKRRKSGKMSAMRLK
jgi:hypothetical protein